MRVASAIVLGAMIAGGCSSSARLEELLLQEIAQQTFRSVDDLSPEELKELVEDYSKGKRGIYLVDTACSEEGDFMKRYLLIEEAGSRVISDVRNDRYHGDGPKVFERKVVLLGIGNSAFEGGQRWNGGRGNAQDFLWVAFEGEGRTPLVAFGPSNIDHCR